MQGVRSEILASRLPKLIENKSPPKVSSIVEQVEYEGARHLQLARFPSVGKDCSVVGLRIFDVGLENKSAIVRDVGSTLKRLDMSGAHLDSLPASVFDQLPCLEQVNVSCNELTDLSLLSESVVAGKIIEVRAESNKLTHLPDSFCHFLVITRLNLSHNELSSWKAIECLKTLRELILDANRLPSMRPEFYEHVKRLEVFHCANNNIQTICPTIRSMTQLRDLNLSGNKLTTVPKELLLLPKLDVLNLSANRIAQIQTLPTRRTQDSHIVSTTDLSDNCLVKFPEQLLSMCEQLDVSKNKILRIPISVEMQLTDTEKTKILQVSDNPLVFPPKDICENGARGILQFFQDLRINQKTYRGIKLSLIGCSGQGKTSLVNALIDEKAYLTSKERTHLLDIFEHDIDIGEESIISNCEAVRNIGEEDIINDYVVAKKTMRLSLWDFSGSECYLTSPLYQFIYQPSYVLIVFSLADYKDDTDFPRLVGDWLHWITARTNKLILLPVATNTDKVSRHRADEICRYVSNGIAQFVSDHMAITEHCSDGAADINQSYKVRPLASEQVKHHGVASRRFTAHVYPKIVRVSSLKYEGFDELLQAIHSLTTDVNTRPHALIPLPSLWNQVIHHISVLAFTLSVPYMTWTAYEEELTQKFGLKRILPQVTQYLHDCGQILWFSSERQRMKDYVILKPSWLLNLLKPIFELTRSSASAVSRDDDFSKRQTGTTADKTRIFKQQLQSNGIADQDVFKAIWRDILKDDSPRQVILDAATFIMERFELGYQLLPKSFVRVPEGAIPELIPSIASGTSLWRLESRQSSESVSRQGTSRQESKGRSSRGRSTPRVKDKSEDTMPSPLCSYVIGCLRNGRDPKNLSNVLESMTSHPHVVAVYCFPRYTPPGLFHAIVVRTQLTNAGLLAIGHWNTGFYAFHKANRIRLLLQHQPNTEEMMSEQTPRSRHASVLSIRICMNSSDPGDGVGLHLGDVNHEPVDPDIKDFINLWSVLTPLMNEIDSFLNLFPGMIIFFKCKIVFIEIDYLQCRTSGFF